MLLIPDSDPKSWGQLPDTVLVHNRPRWLTSTQSAAVDTIVSRERTNRAFAIFDADEPSQSPLHVMYKDVRMLETTPWLSNGVIDAYGRLIQRQATAMG